MAKSKKKKYKKKKNPNRAPQSQNRAAQGGGARKSGSDSGKPAASASNPVRQRQMWIALAVALGVFLLLLLVAQLSNRNNNAEDVTPDTESVQSGDAAEETATEGGDADAEASEGGDTDTASGDADASETSTQSGDTSVTSTQSGDAATTDATASETSTQSGDASATSTQSGDTSATDSNAATGTAASQSADTDDEDATEYADIVVKDYGTITVALDGATAPITVQNFVSLAKSGFYDGLTFHRIMDGFMIQGGDPEGNGTGGAENNIVGEFQSNGFVNNISHTRGTISMARASGDENSASSQFFIVQSDSVFLDGDYAAFGHVTSGMEVVDKICADANPIDDNGTIPPAEQPVIESVTIRDK